MITIIIATVYYPMCRYFAWEVLLLQCSFYRPGNCSLGGGVSLAPVGLGSGLCEYLQGFSEKSDGSQSPLSSGFLLTNEGVV